MAKTKGKTTEKKTDVAQIVAEGWDNGASADDIRASLFAAGIPFDQINKVYKEESIKGGYMKDPVKVRAELAKFMDKVDPEDVESWADVESIQAAAMDKTGCTKGQVTTALKKLLAEVDMDMPKKPRGAGGGARKGKIAEAILAAVVANPKLTKADMYEAALPVVKGPKNAADVTRYFYNVAYGAANGMPLDEVIAATGSEAFPSGVESESEES